MVWAYSPTPTSLTAATRNSYDVPPVSPSTVTLLSVTISPGVALHSNEHPHHSSRLTYSHIDTDFHRSTNNAITQRFVSLLSNVDHSWQIKLRFSEFVQFSATDQIICHLPIYMYSVSQKTGPFSVEHKLGKYCPILIILSLRRQKLSTTNRTGTQRTSNVLVRYLENEQEYIGQHYWHGSIPTCNSRTNNAECNSYGTDMDRINIVSSQAVLEMSSFSMDKRTMSSLPLVNSLVKTRLLKTVLDVDEPSFQNFIHTMD